MRYGTFHKNTGIQIPLDELKIIILSKTKDNYQITQNKLMGESEFREKIYEAQSYKETIEIGAFINI